MSSPVKQAPGSAPLVLAKIQGWREQAEEYRTAAAHCRTAPAREGYERLAATCEHMAEGLAGRLDQEPPAEK